MLVVYRCSCCSTFPPTFSFVGLFNFSRVNGYTMFTLVVLVCIISLVTDDVEYLLIGRLDIFFCEVCVQVLPVL